MPYLLILDDTRSIETVKQLCPENFVQYLPIVLCKDFKEAQLYMINAKELAQHVCFDDNLYSSNNHMNLTGLDFAHWLSHYDECLTQLLTRSFTFSVHSSDPEASKKISEIMNDHKEYMSVGEHKTRP